jgi:hypothetical protein
MVIREFGVWIVVLLGLGLGLAGPAASAGKTEKKDFPNVLHDEKWSVSAGGFLSDFDTEVRWSPSGPLGALIQLEDDLGLAEEIDTVFVAGTYRFSRRHNLSFSFSKLDRTADRIIDERIEFGGIIYDVGADVHTEFDTSWFRVKWKYNVSDIDNLAAGYSLGLSTFDIALLLDGEATVDDPNNPGETRIERKEEQGDFIAPIPVIGIYIDYALTPRWILRAGGDVMKLSIGQHSGRVLEFSFGSDYRLTRLMGIGLGLTALDIDYEQEEAGERLAVDYRISAITAYLNFAF